MRAEQLSIGQVNLMNIPDDRVYVKFRNQFREIFFNCAIDLVGSGNKLEKLIGTKNLREYKMGIYFTPLRVIKRILELFPLDKKNKFTKKIDENVEELRYGYGHAKSIKNPRLPFEFSPILSRIAGHLNGDGGIRFKNDDRTVYYSNNFLILIEQFKEDILKTFGEAGPYEFDCGDGNYMIRFSNIVGLILTTFFGPLAGEFKHVPKLIISADKNCKALFLKALFDDEASVSVSEYKIEFEMANEAIVESVKKILEEFGIRPGKTGKRRKTKNHKMKYRFNICGKQDLEVFNEEIGFDHPEKKKKLEILLKSYQRIQYKRGEIRKLIVKTLKKTREMNIYELAKKLKRKPVFRFREQVRRLEKEGKIKSKLKKMGRTRIKIYYV